MKRARPERKLQIDAGDGCLRARFFAMGSPCELLLDTTAPGELRRVAERVAREAWRIEDKFSRYLEGNVIDRINHADGEPVEVDDETARLIAFAGTLNELSGGGFDITSGVLRRAWHFDGSDRLPPADAVREALLLVGWHRVQWQAPWLTLQPGMELDLGGIGKEYAVDRCASILRASSRHPGLVNFGGDLVATAPPAARSAWTVGIESPESGLPGNDGIVKLKVGALATSGDARRYLLRDGIRYSHILDPATGWPVRDAPRSVTVAADTCTQAGMLSTLAMLKGAQAEAFLRDQGVKFWCNRGSDALRRRRQA